VAQPKITIVGIGETGLSGLREDAKMIVEAAELLVGEAHIIERLTASDVRSGASLTEKRLVIDGGLPMAADLLASAKEEKIVLLAEGDPLFYGVARFFCDKLGKDRFEIIPHVSSMQLAFARVKESWEDAYLTSVSNHSLDVIVSKIRTAEKVGLFTTEECSPSRICQELLDRSITYYWAYVCENLSMPDERVTRGELEEIAVQEFSPLNVLILVRKPNAPDRPSEQVGIRLFGNPDDAFIASHPKRALLTPREIRAIALAELDLGPSSVVWDVGAGCGTVAVEAARLAPGGKVFAIEPDVEDCKLIGENADRFNVASVVVPVQGTAPEAYADLPAPDAVFIGGIGRQTDLLVEQAVTKMKDGARLVAITRNLESITGILEILSSKMQEHHWIMLNISRSEVQMGGEHLVAQNPLFLFASVK